MSRHRLRRSSIVIVMCDDHLELVGVMSQAPIACIVALILLIYIDGGKGIHGLIGTEHDTTLGLSNIGLTGITMVTSITDGGHFIMIDWK